MEDGHADCCQPRVGPEVARRGRAFRAVWAEFARTGRVTAPDDETLVFDRG